MGLSTLLETPDLTFLVAARDSPDYPGVDFYAAAGNQIYDYDGWSYTEVPGEDYSARRLHNLAVPFQPGKEDQLVQTTVPTLPFGIPVLITREGPVCTNSSGPPDSYAAWMSGGGAPMPYRLPLLEAPYTICLDRGEVRGVVICQKLRLDGRVQSKMTLVRASIKRERGVKPSLLLYVMELDVSHNRQYAMPLPKLSDRWQRVARTAVQRAIRHCTPLAMETAELEAARAELEALRAKLATCTGWQQALDLAATYDEFNMIVTAYAPQAGFTGSPYKQARRMVEAYLAMLSGGRKMQVDSWWNELKVQIRPTA